MNTLLRPIKTKLQHSSKVLLFWCLTIGVFVSVAYAMTLTPGQLSSGQFRTTLNNATAAFGKPLNDMRYGKLNDGVCTAFAYRAQQGFESLGVPSRIVWADTSVGYHAFNEVYVDTNGDGLGDSWQIYEPQKQNGQPFFRVNNVQHAWDRAADAPLPGQGSSYAANGNPLGENPILDLINFILMFQSLKNKADEAKKNNELQLKQKDRFEDAVDRLVAAGL